MKDHQKITAHRWLQTSDILNFYVYTLMYLRYFSLHQKKAAKEAKKDPLRANWFGVMCAEEVHWLYP